MTVVDLEIGSSCLKPLPRRKKPSNSPVMEIEKLVVVTYISTIHCIKAFGILSADLALRTSWINFSMSILLKGRHSHRASRAIQIFPSVTFFVNVKLNSEIKDNIK
jgi:hypothetical protein